MPIEYINVDDANQMKKYPDLAKQVRGIPATFVVDSSGKVLTFFAGGLDYNALVARYKQATKK
ncbi:hypothetical protein DYH09_12700 [bacterium CPR1]|nr:hypothetical protein [bacterium CPR1]